MRNIAASAGAAVIEMEGRPPRGIRRSGLVLRTHIALAHAALVLRQRPVPGGRNVDLGSISRIRRNSSNDRDASAVNLREPMLSAPSVAEAGGLSP